MSLIETRRVGGKVHQEHIAMLGTCDVPPSVAVRQVFWRSLHERLARLGNRLDAATRAKLLGDIHARIPMVTPDEQRALQLANAKADAETWGALADIHAGLIASAERARTAAAAEHAKAHLHATHAKDRIAAIARGEDVAGGLGKPVVPEDIMTKAEVARFTQVSEVADAFGFDAMAKAIHIAKDRAERRKLRALHRLIRDGDK